jgi:hypothetical protein
MAQGVGDVRWVPACGGMTILESLLMHSFRPLAWRGCSVAPNIPVSLSLGPVTNAESPSSPMGLPKMTRQANLTRRDFMAAGVAGSLALSSIPQARAVSANDKINVAFIGVGGRGGANLRTITGTGEVNVVALCDVNSRNLGMAAEQHSKARTYTDFRKLYETTKDIDAVVVSTTEHTHAFATLPALRLGKPVYCEKPLTHNVKEARVITQAAAKAGVATQMGTQIHGMPNYRRVVELIQSGAIGNVSEAHVWVSRAWGRQSPEEAKTNRDIISVTERPKKTMTPPSDLDWDLWIGPAPYRPYNEVYFPGPMVGLRKRHDVRPRQPLDRPSILGVKAGRPKNDRSLRSGVPPRDRARVDVSRLRIRPARPAAGMYGFVVPGIAQAANLEGRRDSPVGKRSPVYWRQRNAPV